MSNKPNFVLLRERDFGEVLNDTISFLKLYGRPFYKALIYIILPISLLYGIFIGLFANDMNSIIRTLTSGGFSQGASPLDLIFTWSYAGVLLLGIIENLLLLSTVYGFFKLYTENERDFEVSTVWEEAKTHMLPVFGGIISLIIIMVVVFAIFGGLMAFIGAAIGSGGGIFIVFILMILMFIGMLAFFMIFAMVIPAIVIEKKGVFEAVGRSISLVSNNWGQTFLVLLVAYFVIGTISGLLSLPTMIAQSLISINSLEGATDAQSPLMSFVLIAGSCLSAVGGALMGPILHVCISMQFFNLVERKEGRGIQNMINTFGDNARVDDEEERY